MGVISGILDVSKRSLNAQSLVIRTIGDNITNVNTPGYSRRNAELITTQAAGVGNLLTGTGVEVNRVTRAVDEFLNRELRGRISDRAGAEIRQQYLERAEQPFELIDSPGHIGYEMTQFFASLEDLAVSPADLALRTQVLQRGESLAASIRDTYTHIAGLQREADSRLEEVVSQVNTLTSQIAALNSQIVAGELNDQENLTLRDNRDELLRKLAELVPVSTLEDETGQVLVSLSNGFALVNGGNAQTLSFDRSPSFGPYPVGLDGAGLGNVVYSYGASDVDFNPLLAAGAGQIGDLLRLRGSYAVGDTSPFQGTGDLVEIAGRIEAIARDLLTRFNSAYRGYTGPTGSFLAGGQPAGAAPYAGDEDSATNFFDASTADVDDVLTGTYTPTGIYGLFTVQAGATALTDADADGLADDLAAVGSSNYASNIAFAVTDARQFAAAADLNGTGGVYDFAGGDTANIDNLLRLRNEAIDYSIYGVQSYTSTAKIEEVYRQTVSVLGSRAAKAKSDLEAYHAREGQVTELHSGLTGVSLDEEFAKLINFQRAFQAAARMVGVGDEMFTEVINLLG